MDENAARVHLKIFVYDDGPPPADPLPASLCPVYRSLREPLTDMNSQVTCHECLTAMERFLLL